MLYQVGPITLDTIPLSTDRVVRSGSAGLAAKPVMGRLPDQEFMGPEEDTLTISGEILPTKLGGETELEMVRGLMDGGDPVPVVRGDGKALGWFMISDLREDHREITRDGRGGVVKYSIDLTRIGGEPAQGAGQGIASMLLSLFGAL